MPNCERWRIGRCLRSRARACLRARALLPSRRTLTIAAAVVVAVALAYVAARTTPLFAVKRVEVRGARPKRQRGAPSPASSARVSSPSTAAISSGASSRCRPSSPPSTTAPSNTLTIFVQAERPVAVVAQGGTRWLVSERGRALRRADVDEAQTYPRIELAGTRSPSPGETFETPVVRVP